MAREKAETAESIRIRPAPARDGGNVPTSDVRSTFPGCRAYRLADAWGPHGPDVAPPAGPDCASPLSSANAARHQHLFDIAPSVQHTDDSHDRSVDAEEDPVGTHDQLPEIP